MNQTFYRYRTISVNSLFEISCSAFYASPPSAFNDPFDCGFEWSEVSNDNLRDHLNYLEKDINQNTLDESEEACEQVKLTFDKVIRELGVTCFTTNPLEPLMWAHYADGHRGICLEYKREGLLLDQEKFKPVSYNRPNKLTWSPLNVLNNFDNFLDEIVYKKLPEWKYEKEWRLMLLEPADRIIKLPSLLASVTFGLKCNDNEINKVINIFKVHYVEQFIPFYRVKIDEKGMLVRKLIKIPNTDIT